MDRDHLMHLAHVSRCLLLLLHQIILGTFLATIRMFESIAFNSLGICATALDYGLVESSGAINS